jgi:hypothetical protein
MPAVAGSTGVAAGADAAGVAGFSGSFVPHAANEKTTASESAAHKYRVLISEHILLLVSLTDSYERLE